MVSYESILKYREQFPNDRCRISEPGFDVLVENSEGKGFVSPPTEDDTIFLDRLYRCKKEKRNLFYEEWNPFAYEKGASY